MGTHRRHTKLVAGLVSAAGLLAISPIAAAEIRTFDDGQGRTITLDLQTGGVDAEGYASILRSAIHGGEITTVTTRVVAPQQISSLCGSGAAACYRYSGRRGTITVPARAPQDVRHALLHEYGHHVDFSIDTPQVTGRGGDGTPGWWDSRGIAALLSQGDVAYDYSLGWSRSIAEIYAEDYVQAHGDARFGISWLSAPSGATLDAVRRDVQGVPPSPPVPPDPAPLPPPPTPDPPGPIGAEPQGTSPPAPPGAAESRPKAGKVKRGRTRRSRGRVVTRYAGFVRGGRAVSIRLGARAGRRAAVRAALRRADRRSALRVGIICGRRTLGVRTARRARVALLGRRLGAGRCRVVLRNTGGEPVRFAVRTTLARAGRSEGAMAAAGRRDEPSERSFRWLVALLRPSQ